MRQAFHGKSERSMDKVFLHAGVRDGVGHSECVEDGIVGTKRNGVEAIGLSRD